MPFIKRADLGRHIFVHGGTEGEWKRRLLFWPLAFVDLKILVL